MASAAITTVVTFAERLSPTNTQMPISTARITQVIGKETGKLRPAKAEAPCAFSTATQASNWKTFSAAKNLEPYLPNVDCVVSIAFRRTRAPIRPTKKSSMPPKTWPRISGSQREPGADAAPISMPASISETDIATPNQIIPFEKRLVRFSILDPPWLTCFSAANIERSKAGVQYFLYGTSNRFILYPPPDGGSSPP